MNYQLLIGVIYLIFAALLIFTSAIIFRENPQRRLNRVTSLLLGLAGLAPLFAALGIFIRPAQDSIGMVIPFYQNLSFLWELFFPQLVLFSLVFPAENPLITTNSRIKYLIFIPHLFHIALVTFFAETENLIALLSVDNQVAFFGWVTDRFVFFVKFVAAFLEFLVRLHLQTFAAINLVYIVIALILLYRGLRTVTNKRLKTQTLIVIWGIQSAMGLYMIAYLLPNLTGIQFSGNIQVAIGVIALAIGSGSIIYAIIRYQFLDVRLIVRQSVVYTITSALIVGSYLLIISQFSRMIEEFLGRETGMVQVAFIILALIFFQPIITRVDNLIRKFFIKGRADIRYVTEEISRELSSIIEPEQLQATVIRILKEDMLVEKVRLCLKDEKKQQFVLLSQRGQPEPDLRFSTDDPLFAEILSRGRPVFIDELKLLVKDSSLLKKLEYNGYQGVVPLVNRGQMEGLIALSNKISGYNYNYEDITTLNIIANQLVVALSNARLYQESLEKQQLERELTLARQIQLDLLPKSLPSGEDFQFSAYTRPSRYVGGDFYDFFKTRKDSIGIVIADVSGKGMPAALMVSQIQAMLRSEVRNTDSLVKILENVNYLMATTTSSEKFVTLFYAEFDPESKTLRYSNAGHNYPVVVSADGQCRFLEEGGLLMGAFENARYKSDQIELKSGDLIFFYTDGVNEAHGRFDEQFGEERLFELIKAFRDLSADELTQKIVAEVERFSTDSDLQQDDMTVLTLKLT